jgi:hypothetical protein
MRAGVENGGEIGVSGFVVGVGGLAVLFGGEGIDEADVEVGGAEGALHGTVVFAGACDEHDEIAKLVLCLGLAEPVDGGMEVRAGMVERRGLQEDMAVEVGEEVTGPRLGAIEGDDAEVIGADGLDARLSWLLAFGSTKARAVLGERGERERDMAVSLRVWGHKSPLPKRQSSDGSSIDFFLHYPIPR